jgi:hypothetical protein
MVEDDEEGVAAWTAGDGLDESAIVKPNNNNSRQMQMLLFENNLVRFRNRLCCSVILATGTLGNNNNGDVLTGQRMETVGSQSPPPGQII